MKLKCPDCGKKEMELMSKMDIVTSNFVTEAAFLTAIKFVADWFVPSKYVCKNCGFSKDA